MSLVFLFGSFRRPSPANRTGSRKTWIRHHFLNLGTIIINRLLKIRIKRLHCGSCGRAYVPSRRSLWRYFWNRENELLTWNRVPQKDVNACTMERGNAFFFIEGKNFAFCDLYKIGANDLARWQMPDGQRGAVMQTTRRYFFM